MKSVVALLLFAVLCVFAAEVEYEDGVAVLTNDNFDGFVAAQDLTLIEFYAPWCGHCKKLAPEYSKAAKALNGKIALAKVDCTIETALQNRFGVSGYPTLKVFRKGTHSEYKGPRDAEGIKNFMIKQSLPSIVPLKTLDDVEKFIVDEPAIIYFGDSTSQLYKTFEALANVHRETYRFAFSESKEILEKHGHNNEIVFFQSKRYSQSPVETAKVIATEKTEEGLLKWIRSSFLPFVGEFTDANANLYSAIEKPIVKVYADLDWKLNSKGSNYLLNRIRKVANDFKDKFVFAVASKTKYSRDIEDAGLKGENAFAIYTEKGIKYPSLEQFTPAALKKHLDEYLTGNMKPYIKSEEDPVQDPNGPVVLTGRNFDEIVNDPTKDVIIDFYAPWCGHCKTLEPIYKEVAQKMKKISSNIVVAKIDATANDFPKHLFDVRGFPTIYYVASNRKDAPLSYDSPREVDDFIKFLKKHTTKPLTVGSGKDEL